MIQGLWCPDWVRRLDISRLDKRKRGWRLGTCLAESWALGMRLLRYIYLCCALFCFALSFWVLLVYSKSGLWLVLKRFALSFCLVRTDIKSELRGHLHNHLYTSSPRSLTWTSYRQPRLPEIHPSFIHIIHVKPNTNMGSPICPCSTCFASTSQVGCSVPKSIYRQLQQQQTEQPREKKSYGTGGLLGRLRRSRSIESTASDLVGLRGAAQSVAVGEEGK